jgi:hypothetical protein
MMSRPPIPNEVTMTPEDEALVTKAMLLGCPFFFNGARYYPKLGAQHPLSKGLKAATGMYGQEDPAVLARAWIKYFTEHPHETI